MYGNPNLIVMLTYNDRTVENACEIFEQCKKNAACYWGFKEEGLPIDKMKKLYQNMKKYGKTTFLEVVAYNETDCMHGAKTAVECECDILMGTIYYDSVNEYCKKHNLKYMPFVGIVKERPSVLYGTVDDMVNQAMEYLKKGVYGFDLLGYRYTGDPHRLIKTFTSKIKAPVCIAGSINSYSRLDEIKESGAWSFTIGGAFFEKRFGNDFNEQINNVINYLKD